MQNPIADEWIVPFSNGVTVTEAPTLTVVLNEHLDDDERVQILVREGRSASSSFAGFMT